FSSSPLVAVSTQVSPIASARLSFERPWRPMNAASLSTTRPSRLFSRSIAAYCASRWPAPSRLRTTVGFAADAGRFFAAGRLLCAALAFFGRAAAFLAATFFRGAALFGADGFLLVLLFFARAAGFFFADAGRLLEPFFLLAMRAPAYHRA